MPKSPFTRLLSLLRPFRGQILLALLLSVVTVGSSIALMMTSAWLISTAALQMGITSLGLAPTAVRLFGLSRAGFRYLERLVSHDVTFRLLAHLRVSFYKRIEPLSPSQIGEFSSGDLMSRIVSDIEELQNLYIRVIAPPIVAVIVTFWVGIFFAMIDIWIALVAVLFMVVAGTILPAITWWIGNYIGRYVVESRANINIHLIDTIQGLSDSLAFDYASHRLLHLGDINRTLSHREFQEARLNSVQSGISLLLVHLASFCVLLSATERVEGVLLATVTLGIVAAFEPITPLALATQYLGKELRAAERVFSISDLVPAIESPASPQRRPQEAYHLLLKNVDFRYEETQPWVFRDFSVDIPFGSRVVVTGESGAGKSSLVNILLRFWEFEQGKITVGDTDLRALSHDAVYDLFGVMTQQAHIFNTTIRENIRIADKSASEDAIVAVAKAAQIHDFIMSLPEAYDTYVGENGVSLSGGERQRLALARILLKDAPIWILDEITANLDVNTAHQVLQAAMQSGRDRTIILITHQSAIIKNFEFDQMISLDLGDSF